MFLPAIKERNESTDSGHKRNENVSTENTNVNATENTRMRRNGTKNNMKNEWN